MAKIKIFTEKNDINSKKKYVLIIKLVILQSSASSKRGKVPYTTPNLSI